MAPKTITGANKEQPPEARGLDQEEQREIWAEVNEKGTRNLEHQTEASR